MEGEDNVLDAVFEDDDFMDGGDVEMLDVEEGELVDFNSQSGYGSGQGSGGNVSVANQEGQGTNQKPKPKKKKKKNKKRNNGHWTASIGTDIDRFVIETCKRLKERKSYLVYTAVGCLGIAALSDLIKEGESSIWRKDIFFPARDHGIIDDEMMKLFRWMQSRRAEVR